MDDKRESSRLGRRQSSACAESESHASGGGASLPFLHKLVNLSRPQHLLELVAKAVCAAHGAIGLVSAEGDLEEHVTFGMDEAVALELRRSSWGSELIRFILHQDVPIKVSDFSRDLAARGLPLSLV